MQAGRVPGAPADCPRPTGGGSGGTQEVSEGENRQSRPTASGSEKG